MIVHRAARRPVRRRWGRGLLARFWGTRGSIPAPLGAAGVRLKLADALAKSAGKDLSSATAIETFLDELDFETSGTYGGNTSCVEFDAGGDEYVVCDLGTGVREFGNRALASGGGKKKVFNFFMSHLHWDHIMGFPFFVPAYIPGNTINIHGGHDDMEEAFARQHREPSFPVDYAALGADINFVRLDPGVRHEIAGFGVTMSPQRHGGDSFGYRFEANGRSAIYSTDAEHKVELPDEIDSFVAICRDADMLIFDAMYSLAETVSLRADWGHSSNVMGVEIAHQASVKHLPAYP